ncbi:MAG: hypothetical protein M1820_001462 [Bogoriella megaspora]|nr:MAG: hypothetical protein M1820_001462 [Bogoriella megaspora]
MAPSELCRQKASFLATSSVEKAGNIFGASIFLVLGFSLILELMNTQDDEYEKELEKYKKGTRDTRPPNKWLLDKFLIQTPIMALDGLCFAMIVLANQHSYYCEPFGGHGNSDPNNWKDLGLDTPRDWVFIGLFPGLLVLCGLSNWLRSFMNVFLARWKIYLGLKRWPPALPLLAIVVPLGAATAVFYMGASKCFKVWSREDVPEAPKPASANTGANADQPQEKSSCMSSDAISGMAADDDTATVKEKKVKPSKNSTNSKSSKKSTSDTLVSSGSSSPPPYRV